MNFINFKTICLLMIAASSISAADKVKIIVGAGNYDRKDCIVGADISALNISPKKQTVELYEIVGNREEFVESQPVFDKNVSPKLYFVLSGETKAGAVRKFIAKKVSLKRTKIADLMTVSDDGKALILEKARKPILAYNYALTMPPEGVDRIFARSGYIHPAYTPSGFVLTTIQPKDHRHHYGIWNPWTKLEYDGEIYDLWNLGDGKGTVRAKNVNATYGGSIMAGFNAQLEHIIKNSSGEKVIMNETWSVKAWNAGDGFLWDFESALCPSTALPVLLKEYRYAGFGYRANEAWTNKNCEMMTSEGYSRQKIDGTRARWIYITGETGSGRGGLLLLGFPKNYNYPEPLRIWNEEANGGRGDAFINFAPTKNRDWKLETGKKYTLRYRLFAYDGEMTAEHAEQLWTDFAYPPIVIVESRE